MSAPARPAPRTGCPSRTHAPSALKTGRPREATASHTRGQTGSVTSRTAPMGIPSPSTASAAPAPAMERAGRRIPPRSASASAIAPMPPGPGQPSA